MYTFIYLHFQIILQHIFFLLRIYYMQSIKGSVVTISWNISNV